MENVNLKKLSRKALLEILLDTTKRVEELEEELRKAKEELADREIKIKNAGSIAEAALELNHIFEAAQKAADDYLENIKRQA